MPTPPDSPANIITEFRTNKQFRDTLAINLNTLAILCSSIARSKGFHDDGQRLLSFLATNSTGTQFKTWTESELLQAEFGRIMSEAGEAIEAVRKDANDDHLPKYKGWIAEDADIMVRCLDTAGKRGADIGNALVDKLMFNLTRPHKHGKNS